MRDDGVDAEVEGFQEHQQAKLFGEQRIAQAMKDESISIDEGEQNAESEGGKNRGRERE